MTFDITAGPPPATQHNLACLIQAHDVRTVLEIGSFMGSSALFFARLPCVESVMCIDPFLGIGEWGEQLAARGIPNPFYIVFRDNLRAAGAGISEKVTAIRGRSQDVVDYVLPVDLVYVDGDHSYEGCAADIRLYLPKARKVICGDDYHRDANGDPYFPGVHQACNELLANYGYDAEFWWTLT